MNIAIILAAGKSTRAGQNKLWADVFGQPLWTLSFEAFHKHPEIDRIALVVNPEDHTKFYRWLEDKGIDTMNRVSISDGGNTRMASFKLALQDITTYEVERNLLSDDIVIDHNAANPLVTAEEISAVIEGAKKHGAASVAHSVVDTVIQVANDEEFAMHSLDRNRLRLMQTPQAVRGNVVENLLWNKHLHEQTDLTTALLQHIPVKILPASPRNKKITTAEDLAALCAQTYLGEDSHRFGDTGTLALGGLAIPDLPKLEANSDGDVILHAIGRALAQATGQNFSELADPLMLGGDTDSRDYLAPLLKNITVRSVSLSLECARPKIDPLIPALKSSLTAILKTEQIHISAHTGEDLSPFGLGEGIRCTALVQVLK